MPKLYIKTYGCQMNERDSEQVARMFVQKGYTVTDREDEADVILFNSCSIREQAEQKALGKMGQLTKQRRHKLHVVYGMMGCMAQSKKEELFKDLPNLDLVIGTQKYHRVFEHVDRILRERQEHRMDMLQAALAGSHVCDVAEEEDSQNYICDHLNPGVRSTAYVSIMQGCDMKCAYCIVPYTRGTERSRPVNDVVDEVRRLVDAGVKEITLLGQIVNRYGRQMAAVDGKGGFVQLLEAVHEVAGLQRLRFISPHPIGFRQDLVRAFTYLPKLCSHIHFPMQSGSDRILKLMRRPYKNETYLDLCAQMRQARPDLAITTDVIVGFPGETEEDYLLTRQAVEQVQFDNAFIFRYSPRRGTPAAAMEGQIPEEVKEARNQDLLAVVNEIAIRKNDEMVGTVQGVLLEGPSKTNEARLSGRTSQNKPVMVEAAPDLIGQLLPIRIEESTGFTLYGAPCPSME